MIFSSLREDHYFPQLTNAIMSTPTTRRYPRTLAEAFPADYTYACSVERSRVRVSVISSLFMWAIALVVVGAAIAVAVA